MKTFKYVGLVMALCLVAWTCDPGGDDDSTADSGTIDAGVAYTLTIATNGSGTTIPEAGSHSYPAGTAITVTATAASGNAFAGWTGAATGTANPVTIAMDGNKSLTATFTSNGTAAVKGPCDLYASGHTPCIAAHSTVRALYGEYSGRLYQVRRASDRATKDIATLSPGGTADAAAQDSFCSRTTCVVTVVYDQSGKGNHLEYQGQGSSCGGQADPAVANKESLTVGGHKVYSLYIEPGNSYWRNGSKTGVPTGAAPEGMYMVTSGTHVNAGCCFDYGNSETTRKADGAGAMDAINFSTQCWFGKCSGTGPWVQADLEYGLYSGGSQSWNSKQKAFPNKYVTAMLKNDGKTTFALKGGNAQSGSLTTLWNGKLPNGYSPMKKQGAIVLGSGGDCCATNRNQSLGTFYEGAMVSGYPTDAVDDAIQANILAAGYGR